MCEHAPGTTEGAIERADRLEALGILQDSRGGTVAEFGQSDVRYTGPKRTSGKKAEKVDVQDGDRFVETLNLSKADTRNQSASSWALVSIQGEGMRMAACHALTRHRGRHMDADRCPR